MQNMSVQLYSTTDVATLYGVKHGTVLQWVFRGQLTPTRKLANGWVYTRADLREFDRRRRARPTHAAVRAVRRETPTVQKTSMKSALVNGQPQRTPACGQI